MALNNLLMLIFHQTKPNHRMDIQFPNLQLKYDMLSINTYLLRQRKSFITN